MPEYTVVAAVSVVLVVGLELLWLRTGVLRSAQYWLSMAIVLFFQVLVDGWLTRLPDAIVRYDPDQVTGLRFPFDIPVEDYLFGYSLVTLTILLWVRAGGQADGAARSGRTTSAGASLSGSSSSAGSSSAKKASPTSR